MRLFYTDLLFETGAAVTAARSFVVTTTLMERVVVDVPPPPWGGEEEGLQALPPRRITRREVRALARASREIPGDRWSPEDRRAAEAALTALANR